MNGSATATVPYGFICGWPTKGGDLYGGNLYGTSAAAGEKGLQAVAQGKAAALWGGGRAGQEVIGHSVCKGKYQPWKPAIGAAKGSQPVRQYGCARHHALRKKKVGKYGLRKGWEPFDQWPLPVTPTAAAGSS